MSTELERIATLEAEIRDTKEDLKEVREDVKGLKRFTQWLAGGASVIGFIFGILSDTLKHKLGLS
jgi:hypothetical protein